MTLSKEKYQTLIKLIWKRNQFYVWRQWNWGNEAVWWSHRQCVTAYREFGDSKRVFIFAHLQTLIVMKIIPLSRAVQVYEWSFCAMNCVSHQCAAVQTDHLSTLLYIELLEPPLLNSAVKNIWRCGFWVAGGTLKSLPAGQTRKQKKKVQLMVGCLIDYEDKPSTFYIDSMFVEKLAPSVPL